jgi:hypothetical protein
MAMFALFCGRGQIAKLVFFVLVAFQLELIARELQRNATLSYQSPIVTVYKRSCYHTKHEGQHLIQEPMIQWL